MKKIIIILFINIFFFSCIDSIIDEKFYESIHLQGSGWMDFYQNSSDIKRSFNDNYSTQIWFSGQENSSESAGCILNVYDDDDDISIYRNPNISNHLMIYVNDILFEEVEIENLNLDNKNNFLLLSLIKEEDYIRLYINDMFILNECIVPIESLNLCEINGYNWNALTSHCTYATSASSDCVTKGICSDNQYNNNEDGCNSEGSCSNPIYDNQNECINANICSDISYDNEEECNSQGEMWDSATWNYANTWSSSNLIWDSKINLQLENAQISIGSAGNSNNDYANFWYGYIDEIRLWDIALSNENILFHNQYPNKVVESYESLEFNAIIGIWDFKINTTEENIPYQFQYINEDIDDIVVDDDNDDDEFIIIYNQGEQDNELSTIGR